MHSSVSITPAQLPDVLLHVSVTRPVFLWGQPGIGKSSLVADFAKSLGLDCVSLLGTQLAPEDLIGVPQIFDTPTGPRSRFCPPSMVARDDPYCLFLDELNGASLEVQKAFYSLILERRLGDFRLHPGAIVIGAGNRSQDSAIVRPMSSALVNRMVHIHLSASPRDWLDWARRSGIHPWVLEYIALRPDHLTATPPKHEEPFSTPRAWHMLSDTLHSSGDVIADADLFVLAAGCLSPAHAGQFRAFVKQLRHAWDLEGILKGTLRWPSEAADRDAPFLPCAEPAGPPCQGTPGRTKGAVAVCHIAGAPGEGTPRRPRRHQPRDRPGRGGGRGSGRRRFGRDRAADLVPHRGRASSTSIQRRSCRPASARFVIGHELLHAGLRHDTRAGGRDPWIWNVACDYVINGWLVEMGVGEMPDGLLYDAELKGMSAEEVYDRVTTDLRRLRKLRTLRGVGACDILPGRVPLVGEQVAAVGLDEFYRRALASGLEMHRSAGRGLVPAGLVEAINALAQPPIGWDVELAQWFDDHFPALERRRT